jgi:hypothetical protein
MLAGKLDDPPSVGEEERAREDEQRVRPLGYHRTERRIVVAVPSLDDEELDAEGCRCFLRLLYLDRR